MELDPKIYREHLRDKQTRYARTLSAYVVSVRYPLLGFLVGVSLANSGWWMVLYAVVFIIVALFPNSATLFALLSLPLYLLTDYPWPSCILLGLGFVLSSELHGQYLLTRKQAGLLLSDLLAPEAKYVLEEVLVPQSVLDGFLTFHAKSQFIQRFIARAGWVDNTSPVRMFRFTPTSDKATGAAAAFPFFFYASLLFVRTRFEDMTDGQRFQIYHELAHGTPEGFDILLRPLRWEAARVVAALMTYCMYAGCAFVLFREPTSVVNWFAASALVWAGMWRSSGVTNQNFIAIGSSEALADSVALAHPDFLREDRWRQRAMSLLRRLLDEAEGADRTDPKSYAILARIIWLKRSIRQPSPEQYIGADLELRFIVAFALYVLAGFNCTVSASWGPVVFWPMLIILLCATFHANRLVAESVKLVLAVDRALRERLVEPSLKSDIR